MIAHLWQSTLFAGVVWLAVLALRANHARVRYWLWTAASVKFLVPFSWLMELGAQFQWRTAAEVALPAATFVIDEVLTPPVLAALPVPSTTASSASVLLPWMIGALWLAGTLAVLAWWSRQWRPVGAALRAASPVDLGPPVDPSGLVVMSSPSALEPGVVGIWRPVLLLPDGLTDRLTPAQMNALIAHERCHIRCHDNLLAGIHMIVEAAFWFHPLVWWIERRMIDERERACDEAVLRAGSEPEDYAEGILEVCRSSIESPLACVAGVSGANLPRRIESIMGGEHGRPMTIARRFGLAMVGVAVLSMPVVAGLGAPAIPVVAVGQEPDVPVSFEVAAVRLNRSGEQRASTSFNVPGGGFSATNAPLRLLILQAYQISDNQLVGAPEWIRSERFDITARLEREPPSVPRSQAGERELALRSLLAERFKLMVHRETREVPMYALVMGRDDGKPGPMLKPASADCSPDALKTRIAAGAAGKPVPGLCGSRFNTGRIAFGGYPLSEFAKVFSPHDGRTVVDRTGLTGNWEFELTFTPDPGPQASPGQDAPVVDHNLPSLPAALQEQLGLRLEPIRGTLEVLVVDRVEPLTEDQAGAPTAAAPLPEFDVTSIRENRSGEGGGGGGPRPDGRYTLTNMSTRSLVSIAYEIPNIRILGGPDWLNTTRYDMAAVGKAGSTEQEWQGMLQAMLRDRFQLRAHVERRDLPVYFLTVARSDGRLGPNVKPAAVNCRDFEAAKKAMAAAKVAGLKSPCGITFAQTGYVIGGERLAILEGILTSASGRPVLDRTGLTGPYDVEFQWSRVDAERPDGLSIFTAVQEQLGLRLESGTAPLDVVVIDAIERPSEN